MATMKYFLTIATLLVLTACTTTDLPDDRQLTADRTPDSTGMGRQQRGDTMMEDITSEEMFIARMIPHHQEAIDSSRMMLDSNDSRVRDLAQQIIDDQEQEVTMLQSWLNQWYPGAQPASMQRMMPDLGSLEDIERDRAYLRGMREHHAGAIDMAEQAKSLNLRPEVREFADDVITKQKAEIAEIDMMLQ